MINVYPCYIDPGTGSMLLTVILSLVTSAIFLCRGLLIKLKVKFSGGEIEDTGKVPYTIFSDHKRYWNVFESICDEFEKREIPCVYLTGSEDDPALSKDYHYVKAKFIGEGNRCFAVLNTMRSYICLSTTPGLDVLQWKRSKNVDWYAHIYHALEDGLLYRMFALDYYDAILASGDIHYPVIRELEKQRNMPEKEMLDRLQARFPENDMLEWNYDNDNFKVLSEADILISDFSGVMFDYAFIFDRPFIYTNEQFDSAPYEAAWLERKPWLLKVLPEMGRELKDEDIDHIKEVIDETIGSQAYKENREKCKDEAWQYRGHAAERTVDYMVAKYEDLRKAETKEAKK